jgi:hypothetical protein
MKGKSLFPDGYAVGALAQRAPLLPKGEKGLVCDFISDSPAV